MSAWPGIQWAAPLAVLTVGCSQALPPEPGTAATPPDRLPASVAIRPAVRPAPPFLYESGGLRDPFQAPVSEWDPGDGHRQTAAPDLRRVRTALEGFAMEEIRMVGTLSGQGVHSALVRDPGGQVHAVRVGDYVGRDFGRIEAIGDAGLVLLEAIADGSGDWVTRTRTLPMYRPDTASAQPLVERPGDA